MSPSAFLTLALKQASAAFARGEYPVGAVLVDEEGKVLGQAHNSMRCDSGHAQHAEIQLLMQHQELLYRNQYKVGLYSSLEPCVMCLGAAYVSRLAIVAWAANDYWAGGTRCIDCSSQFVKQHPLRLVPTPCPDLEKESVALLRQFLGSRQSPKEAQILGPYLTAPAFETCQLVAPPPVDGILSHLQALEASPDFADVEALMVGGSVGRGEATANSDLDLFMFVQSSRLQHALHATAKTLLSTIGKVVLLRGPIWVEGFGYSFTALYEKGNIIQMNVNCINTLTPDPMRNQRHLMLFDKNGSYAACLASLNSHNSPPTVPPLDQAATFCALRLTFVANELAKGELWLAIRHLQDAREQLFVILRVLSGALPPWLNMNQPAKKIEEQLGSMLPADLASTLPRYSQVSIANAALTLSEQLVAATRGAPLEPQLFRSIDTAVRLLQSKLNTYIYHHVSP